MSLGFGVFAPSTLDTNALHEYPTGDRLTLSTRDQTLWAGVGLAVAVTPRLRLGASLFGVLRTASADLTFDLALAPPDTSGVVASFEQIRITRAGRAVGLTAVVGVQWDARPELTLGLAVRAPAIALHSRTREFEGLLYALPATDGPFTGSQQTARAGTAADVLPRLHLAVGAAWRPSPRWRLAADLVLDDADDRHEVTPNASLGVELRATDSLALRGGAFTNLATTPTNVVASGEPHVDQFGLSLGVGLMGDHTETILGISASYGRGHAAGFGGDVHRSVLEQRPLEIVATRAEQLEVYVFLGTSYQF